MTTSFVAYNIQTLSPIFPVWGSQKHLKIAVKKTPGLRPVEDIAGWTEKGVVDEV